VVDRSAWKTRKSLNANSCQASRLLRAVNHSLGVIFNGGLGFTRFRPPGTFADSGFATNLAKSDLLRQCRPLCRVIRRNHGIVGWQVPFLAVLLRRQTEPRQVANRLPSSRQIRKSGVIDLRIGTAGVFTSI
jgi:hypothetical protein